LCNSLPIIQASLNSVAASLYSNWTSYFNLNRFLDDSSSLLVSTALNLTNNSVYANDSTGNISNSSNHTNLTNIFYTVLNTTITNSTFFLNNFTQHLMSNFTANISLIDETTNQINLTNLSTVNTNFSLQNISNVSNYSYINLNATTTKNNLNVTLNTTQITNQTQTMNTTITATNIPTFENSSFQCYFYTANSFAPFNVINSNSKNISNCSNTNYCTFEISV